MVLYAIAHIVMIAVCLVVSHEAAHILTTVVCGGRFDGLVHHHVLWVGVKVRLDGLSKRQMLATLFAAPVAELIVISIAWRLMPSLRADWGILLATQWLANGIPWPGLRNDGHHIVALLRQP